MIAVFGSLHWCCGPGVRAARVWSVKGHHPLGWYARCCRGRSEGRSRHAVLPPGSSCRRLIGERDSWCWGGTAAGEASAAGQRGEKSAQATRHRRGRVIGGSLRRGVEQSGSCSTSPVHAFVALFDWASWSGRRDPSVPGGLGRYSSREERRNQSDSGDTDAGTNGAETRQPDGPEPPFDAPAYGGPTRTGLPRRPRRSVRETGRHSAMLAFFERVGLRREEHEVRRRAAEFAPVRPWDRGHAAGEDVEAARAWSIDGRRCHGQRHPRAAPDDHERSGCGSPVRRGALRPMPAHSQGPNGAGTSRRRQGPTP